MERKSPSVTASDWGVVEVGRWGRFRDVKLFPGGARGWDWTETGTHHVPGIQPGDVAELLEAGAQVVVLSRGRHGRLRVPEATVAWIRAQGVEVQVHETSAAIDAYNELAVNTRVGALIHSTC